MSNVVCMGIVNFPTAILVDLTIEPSLHMSCSTSSFCNDRISAINLSDMTSLRLHLIQACRYIRHSGSHHDQWLINCNPIFDHFTTSGKKLLGRTFAFSQFIDRFCSEIIRHSIAVIWSNFYCQIANGDESGADRYISTIVSGRTSLHHRTHSRSCWYNFIINVTVHTLYIGWFSVTWIWTSLSSFLLNRALSLVIPFTRTQVMALWLAVEEPDVENHNQYTFQAFQITFVSPERINSL